MLSARSARTALLLGLVASFGATQANAQRACTVGNVRGHYGHSIQGTWFLPVPGTTTLAPAPFSMICTVTIEHNGQGAGSCVSAVGTEIVEAEIASLTVDVQPDCTATATYRIRQNGVLLPGEAVSKWLIFDYGELILELYVKPLIGKPVGVGQFRRISIAPSS